MKRLLISELIRWKSNPHRKPLILNGARQVGKTWLLQHFGATAYTSVAYVNCERQENLDAIFMDFDVQRMIRTLSAVTHVDIVPERTLIILDEIQEFPRALTSMKYFCEDAPEYHIAVASSLLGISLHGGVSFPVGKVDMLQLYPMSFEEFLYAKNETHAAEILKERNWNLIDSLSSHYIELLRQYYFVGGMPAVVKAYIDGSGPNQVRQLQQQILSDYRRDFSKHAEGRELPRINQIWDSIPRQLARENKKFLYREIKPGARSSQYELALQWMIDAGLVYRVPRIKEARMPIKFYEEYSVFKLFPLDVGLLGAQIEAPADKILVGDNAFKEYKGAFSEAFVLTQLMPLHKPIAYYSTNNSQIEIDFVFQDDSRVIPIEVKAEANVKSKSLRTFIDKYPELMGLRISMRPYIDQGWMENIPLYGIPAYFR